MFDDILDAAAQSSPAAPTPAADQPDNDDVDPFDATSSQLPGSEEAHQRRARRPRSGDGDVSQQRVGDDQESGYEDGAGSRVDGSDNQERGDKDNAPTTKGAARHGSVVGADGSGAV